MMLVEKKTDEGQIHAFSNTRVVVVCSQDVNKISPVTVFGTDNLAKVSHKATIASAYPWKYKLDTKKAFRRIEPTEMPPKLTQRLTVVFIPQPAAGLATSAVYNQFGCKSPTRFLEMFDRHFEFTSSEAIDQVVSDQILILSVLTEQRRRSWRAPESMSEI